MVLLVQTEKGVFLAHSVGSSTGVEPGRRVTSSHDDLHLY